MSLLAYPLNPRTVGCDASAVDGIADADGTGSDETPRFRSGEDQPITNGDAFRRSDEGMDWRAGHRGLSLGCVGGRYLGGRLKVFGAGADLFLKFEVRCALRPSAADFVRPLYARS